MLLSSFTHRSTVGPAQGASARKWNVWSKPVRPVSSWGRNVNHVGGVPISVVTTWIPDRATQTLRVSFLLYTVAASPMLTTDEDNTFSIPSLPSPSPTPYAPLNRLSDAGPSGLQTQSKSPYPASNMPRKYPSLDTPQMYPIIPESPESPHMHLTFPSAPAAHPMRPRPQSGSFTCSPELPSSFNTGFPAPLSLSTSVSHMRTPMPMTPMVKPVIKHACLP